MDEIYLKTQKVLGILWHDFLIFFNQNKWYNLYDIQKNINKCNHTYLKKQLMYQNSWKFWENFIFQWRDPF